MMRRLVLLFMLCLLLVVPATAAQDGPVVHAILLYSPTCPHCHTLITTDLPPILQEYGDSLYVLPVDVTSQIGDRVARSLYERYEVPREMWVVPMMLIDENILVGGVQIPTEMPGIIRDGLAKGGVPLPDLDGAAEYKAAYDEAMAEARAAAGAEDEAIVEAAGSGSVLDRLAADPIANALAIAVLVGLVIGLVLVVVFGFNSRLDSMADLIRVMTGIGLVAALIVSVVLVSQPVTDALATPLAWAILVLVIVAGGLLLVPKFSAFVVPAVALFGLIDAFYLAYVELTASEAVCGAVGNCNAVQQSPYATVLGVPVGVLGVVAYVAILLMWGLSRTKAEGTVELSQIMLLGLTLFGTAFSIYLTFLEPFVIGATCAWCLLSAISMFILLWQVAPAGWAAVNRLRASDQPAQKKPA